jgi:uncharacterized RDD family membrane protein YckC
VATGTDFVTSGLARRFAAICYDWLLLIAVLALFTALVLVARGGSTVAPSTAWFQVSLVAVAGVFFAWFWTHGGQTLGMRAWRIRVVREDGAALTWRDALLRVLAASLAALPAGLGFFWCLVDANGRCWHDRVTRTRVRYEKPAKTSVSESAAARSS